MKEDYIDRTVIKLRRKYTKDELVSALNKQLSEKDIEIGKLKSEIEHLAHELNSINVDKELNRKARTEVRKEEAYKNIKLQNKSLQEQNKKLKQLRDELLYKIGKYENNR